MPLDSLILAAQLLTGSASLVCLYEKNAVYLGIAGLTITLALGLIQTKKEPEAPKAS